MSTFLGESLAAVRVAPTPAELDRIYAMRITALIFDSGTMRDLRQLAAARVQRRHQPLDAALDGDQP